jgi:hypothetical protein
MAAMTLDISNVTRKYKSEQRFFSQWVMKTVADLDIPCTTDHHTHSESRTEPSIHELRWMTDDIAVYIQQTENLPEGIRVPSQISMTSAVYAHRKSWHWCLKVSF